MTLHDPNDWFNELGLDPTVHPVVMGTRALGDKPWLVRDDNFDDYIALKRELLRTKRVQVLYETPASTAAVAILADLVGAAEPTLEAAALQVQEDLCLVERRAEHWYLDASCLCFPTRWHLRDKVDRSIGEVHGPVNGYSDRIGPRVDTLFDRLTERPVIRRNWFLMTDPALFQPDRPGHEMVIDGEHCLDRLYIRSERQTLRRLCHGWIVFTIRIQQKRLGALADTPERRAIFAAWVENVSDDFGRRRHLTPMQRRPLLNALSG